MPSIVHQANPAIKYISIYNIIYYLHIYVTSRFLYLQFKLNSLIAFLTNFCPPTKEVVLQYIASFFFQIHKVSNNVFNNASDLARKALIKSKLLLLWSNVSQFVSTTVFLVSNLFRTSSRTSLRTLLQTSFRIGQCLTCLTIFIHLLFIYNSLSHSFSLSKVWFYRFRVVLWVHR